MPTHKKNIAVLTGAGISAESGLKTFRDADGLWEGYRMENVATPEAWERDFRLVQAFYNDRRKNVLAAQPNAAHFALVKLQQAHQVTIITQNIDDLHERAGAKNVIHLHGIITKAQSSRYPHLVYDLKGDTINEGDFCEKGFQLRPHVVWFGEPVPMIEKGAQICAEADILIIVGTSLQVYPAAGLLYYAGKDTPVYVVDKNIPNINRQNLVTIEKPASVGLPELVDKLM